MSKGKIIIVVTNHSEIGKSGIQTGWYLPEVAQPHHVLATAGYEIVYVSPKGGEAPMDNGSGKDFKNDTTCQAFLKDHAQVLVKDDGVTVLKNTLTAGKVNPAECKALFYAGGYGPMFDLPEAKDIAELAAKIYKQGGILSAVCHGPVGFVPVEVDGKPLVNGQTVTSFTNKEEGVDTLAKHLPFMLESKLKELGGKFVEAENFQCNVQVCGRLISGQNPASAIKVAEEMVTLLAK